MLFNQWFRYIVCLTGFALTFSSLAQEPTIRFGINASPPFHINSNIQQQLSIPAGFCDQLVESVSRHLSDASIEVRRLPAIRIQRLMKRQENLCFPCLIRRSSYNPDYYFSDPVYLYQPHGIITRVDLAQQLVEKFGSPISFAQLAAETELRFAQPSGRKYGDVQPILESHLIDTPRHRVIFGENALFNLLTMILSDRVDYTVDYQMMIPFHQKLTKTQDNSLLAFIPIAEYNNAPITGAIGCARNDWGKQAIEQINNNLNTIKNDPALLQSLDYWLGKNRPKIVSSQ